MALNPRRDALSPRLCRLTSACILLVGLPCASMAAPIEASPQGRGLAAAIAVPKLAAIAGTATITVQLNTPMTVDMRPYITGSGLSGIALASAPMHGAVTVDGTNLTFTPARDYFGVDAFTYTVFGSDGPSAPGVVNVLVAGRLDLAQDAALTGLVAAQYDAAQRFSRAQISNFQRRLESLHSRADNAPPADRATGESGSAAGMGPGFWLYGVGNFGTREANGAQSGLEFSTSGISAGADRRFSDEWAFGLGAGYGRDKTDVGSDGTQSKAQGYAVSAYGSWQPGRTTYIDALLGYGSLDFDTQRYVTPMNEYARASRSGSQFLASVAAGYEHRMDAMLVSPYARLDFASSKLDAGSESGAGQYALRYSGQTVPFFQGSLGIRAESVHETGFGWAAPRIRAEYQHVFKGDRDAAIGYADQAGGPQYTVTTGATSGNALMLGVGSDFVRRDGWSVGFDYQLLRSSTDTTSHTVRLAVAKDLDGRGWPFASGSWLPVSPPHWLQFDAGYQYDDNVNRTNVASERLPDSIYSVTANKALTYTLGENTRGLLNVSAGLFGFKTYEGLDQAYLGVQGNLEYRTSGEYDATTFALFAKAFADEYRSDLRDGQRYSVGVSARQALTDRIGILGALAYNIRNARSEVWDNHEATARLSFDYALTSSSTLYLVGEYRRGNIVSSTNKPTLEQLDIANVFVRDNAFPGNYFAYQFDGRTVVSSLGWNLSFGSRDSLDFSWIRAQSTPDSRPSFASTPPDYVVNQYSIVYLMRF